MAGFPADAAWWVARLLRPVRSAAVRSAEDAADVVQTLPVVVGWGLEATVVPPPLVLPYAAAALGGGVLGRAASDVSTAVLAGAWGGVVALHAAGGAFAAEPGVVWMQTGWAWTGTALTLAGFRWTRRLPLAVTGLGVGASLAGWTSFTLGLPAPWGVGLIVAAGWPWVAEATRGWASAAAGAALMGEVLGAPWGAGAWVAFVSIVALQRLEDGVRRWWAAKRHRPDALGGSAAPVGPAVGAPQSVVGAEDPVAAPSLGVEAPGLVEEAPVMHAIAPGAPVDPGVASIEPVDRVVVDALASPDAVPVATPACEDAGAGQGGDATVLPLLPVGVPAAPPPPSGEGEASPSGAEAPGASTSPVAAGAQGEPVKPAAGGSS